MLNSACLSNLVETTVEGLQVSCTGHQIIVEHKTAAGPARQYRIVFDSSDGGEPNASCLLPLFLLPAMAAGAGLEIEGPVCPRLLQRAGNIQDLYESWMPGVSRVGIRAAAQSTASREGTALLFTGGVDSIASLIDLKDQVTELVTVHGYDFPVAQSFERRIAHLQCIGDYFRKPLVVVRTDLRDFTDSWFQTRGHSPWGFYHGAALMSALIARARSVGVIASSYSYTQLHPWGSHPVLDPLWSTENTAIVHHGTQMSRVQKIRLVGSHPVLLEHLRVCWEGQQASNCGRCMKCLLTMTALEGLGLLRDCPAFPAREVDPALLKALVFTGSPLYYWRELADLPLRPEIGAFIRRLLRDSDLGLPSGGGLKRRIKRVVSALGRAAKLLKAAVT